MHKGTMRRGLRVLLGLAGAAMFGGAALAADMGRPVYKAPPAGALPVSYDWTGFYVGGHVGYGWADKSWTDAFGLGTSHTADGFLGGGQVGFNYQINQFVLGVEGDVSWANLKGDSTQVFGLAAPVTQGFNSEVDWTATLTGRLGFAFDRWLVYGKGGAAWAEIAIPPTATPSRSPPRSPIPVSAGPPARASNTPSRRNGRRSSSTTTWTSARVPIRSRPEPRPTSTSRSTRSSSA